MSREVRRVPLDFDWPLNKTWGGYLVPDSLNGEPCTDCHGGTTHAGQWVWAACKFFDDLVRDVSDQKRGRTMHPYLCNFGRAHGSWVYPEEGDRQWRLQHGTWTLHRPSEDMVEFASKLTGRDPERFFDPFMGDGVGYEIFKMLSERTGVKFECETCEGRGEHEKYPGQRQEREDWEPTEPPLGPGYQLWQTVSEGAPISPVFETPEDLAEWMTLPGNQWGADRDLPLPTFDSALAFVRAGWAPSMIDVGNGPEDGVKVVGEMNSDKDLGEGL